MTQWTYNLIISLLCAICCLPLTGNSQPYVHDVCGGGGTTLLNGVNVTCSNFGVNNGTVSPITGTADPGFAPLGTQMAPNDVSHITGNAGGWTNYMGIGLHFDELVYPSNYFFGADLDQDEQMSIFGYNEISNKWINPVSFTLGAGANMTVIDEALVNDFPLPPGAVSPAGAAFRVLSFNDNSNGDLAASNTASQFYVDFGDQPVSDIYFILAKSLDGNTTNSNGDVAILSLDSLERTPIADLEMDKIVTTSSPNIGASIDFIIMVTNSGPDAANNIQIQDIIPSGYSVNSISPSTGNFNAGTGIWDFATLGVGASEQLVINTTVLPTGLYNNFAEVIAMDEVDPDSNPAEGKSTDDYLDDIEDDDEDEVTVIPNRPPVAVIDQYTIDIDTPGDFNVLANDSDPDNNITVNSINTLCGTCSGVSNGTLVNNLNGTFTYTPNSGFTGSDMFTYQICDAGDLCDTATVFINVEDLCINPCNAVINTQNNCLNEISSFTGANSFTCQASAVNSWEWDFGDGSTASGVNPSHMYASGGTFTVELIIGDDLGCVDTITEQITVFDNPTTSLSNETLCVTDPVFMPTSGSPSGGTYSGAGFNNNEFDPASVGSGTFTYQYNYTNSDGCADSSTATITVLDNPTVSLAPFTSPVCEGSGTVTLTGGSPAGGVYSGPGVSGDLFNPTAAGFGSFPITYTYSNANGCTDSATQIVQVQSFQLTQIPISICAGDSYTLSDGTVINSPGLYIDSMPGAGQCGVVEFVNLTVEGLSNDTIVEYICSGFDIVLPGGEVVTNPGIYTELLTTGGGCDSLLIYRVERDEILCLDRCELKVPSAFTPNDDGNNDDFRLLTVCDEIFNSYELRIYNRWGQEVFSAASIDESWDGTFGGQTVPMDSYTYVAIFDRERVEGTEVVKGIVIAVQ